MKEKIKALNGDPLVRNSFYLMLTTGVMAVLGFAFWLIAARLFTPEQVGIATTLISAMTLLSFVGLLGFNSTFVRELPSATDRNTQINTGLTLSVTLTMVIALGYVLLVPVIAPELIIVQQNWWYAAGFIFMVAFAAVNLLTDSIFIALRAAKYNLFIDGFLMSGAKLALPFLLVGLGAYGLFVAAGAAAGLALIASVVALVWRFGYRPRLQVDMSTLKRVFAYSSSNYFANLLNIAPTLVLPLIILNGLGAAATGFYYLAYMVANLLYTIVFSMSQSLFAEGAYGERALRDLVKKAALLVAAILVPGAAVIFVGADVLLGFFGKAYAAQAANLLQVLALASPAVCLYALGVVILRITKRLKSLMLVNAVYAAVICGLAWLWVDNGLLAIGYAWFIGNLAAGMLGFVLVWWERKKAITLFRRLLVG